MYVLVDVLDIVIVLFQSGVLEYILVYSGWGGAVVHICETYLCTPRKLLRGAENENAKRHICSFLSFQRLRDSLSHNPEGNLVFYKNILRTSAVSSTNFGSILIFASCVVGTCNILQGLRSADG